MEKSRWQAWMKAFTGWYIYNVQLMVQTPVLCGRRYSASTKIRTVLQSYKTRQGGEYSGSCCPNKTLPSLSGELTTDKTFLESASQGMQFWHTVTL